MASIALSGSCNMAGAFAGGHRTVVASIARRRRLSVINGHGKHAPTCANAMTAVAGVAGERMCCRLTYCSSAIVTTNTGIRSFIMRERQYYRQPN